MTKTEFNTNLKGLNQLDIGDEYDKKHTFLLTDDEAKDLAKQIVDKMELVI